MNSYSWKCTLQNVDKYRCVDCGMDLSIIWPWGHIMDVTARHNVVKNLGIQRPNMPQYAPNPVIPDKSEKR